jgi:hypothetical protein
MINEGYNWSKGQWNCIKEWFLEIAKEVAPAAVAKLENPRCTVLGDVVYIHEDHDTDDYDTSYSKYIGARLSIKPSFKTWYDEFENNVEFESTVRQDLRDLNSAQVITTQPGQGCLAFCADDFKRTNLKAFPLRMKTIEDIKAERVNAMRRARQERMSLGEAIRLLESNGWTVK